MTFSILWLCGWILTLFMMDRKFSGDGFTWFAGPVMLIFWPLFVADEYYQAIKSVFNKKP